MSNVNTKERDLWILALGSKEGTDRQAARENLVAMGRDATPILTPLLGHEEVRVRWEAALALKEVSDPASARALAEALGDEDGDVRWVAAEALAGIGRAGVTPLLEGLTENADSFELRDAAPVAISLLRDPALQDLLEPVYRALKDGRSPEVVMAEAGKALRLLGKGEPPVV